MDNTLFVLVFALGLVAFVAMLHYLVNASREADEKKSWEDWDDRNSRRACGARCCASTLIQIGGASSSTVSRARLWRDGPSLAALPPHRRCTAAKPKRGWRYRTEESLFGCGART